MQTEIQPIPDFAAYLIAGNLDLTYTPTWQRPIIRKVAKWLRDGGNIVESLNEGGTDNYERLQFASRLLKATQLPVPTMRLSGGNMPTGDYVKVVNYAGNHSFRVEVAGRQVSNIA